MTKKQVVSKFLSWADRQKLLKLKSEQLDMGHGKCECMEFSITQYTEAGTPWTTVCLEIFPKGTAPADGWYEVIKRKCSGKLNIDQFSEIGIGDCGSIEEFMFKLEISG